MFRFQRASAPRKLVIPVAHDRYTCLRWNVIVLWVNHADEYRLSAIGTAGHVSTTIRKWNDRSIRARPPFYRELWSPYVCLLCDTRVTCCGESFACESRTRLHEPTWRALFLHSSKILTIVKRFDGHDHHRWSTFVVGMIFQNDQRDPTLLELV